MILLPLTAEQLQYLVSDIGRFERSVSCRYDGEPPEGEAGRFFRGQIEAVREAGENFARITFWVMVSKDTKTIMGSLDFKNLPDASGSVEIGYGIGPAYQRMGYTTEAVGAMVRWAFLQPDVGTVKAEVERSNTASQRVLQKNGFKKYRTIGNFDWYCIRKTNLIS